MRTPSDAYLRLLSPLLHPCQIHSVEFVDGDHWLIKAIDDKRQSVLCNVCKRPGVRFDHNWRKVRHLNFASKQVFILLELPRVQCMDHGVRNAHQLIAHNCSKYSPAFQEYIHREYFSGQPIVELAQKLMVPKTTIIRIVQNLTTRKLEESSETKDAKNSAPHRLLRP